MKYLLKGQRGTILFYSKRKFYENLSNYQIVMSSHGIVRSYSVASFDVNNKTMSN